MPNKEGYYWVKLFNKWRIVEIKKRYFLKSDHEFDIFTCGSEVTFYENEVQSWGPQIEEYKGT